jgi:hypothetical protein
LCKSCGLPQITGPDETPQITPKKLTERRHIDSAARLAKPVLQWTGIALAAVVVFAVGFVIGKRASGDTVADIVTAQTTTTADQATQATNETTSTPKSTTTATTTTTTTTTTEPPFTYNDVPADHEYASEIQALLDAGVVSPCTPPDGTEFCPNEFLTREALASMFAQMFQYDDPGDTDLFLDDNESPFQPEIQAIAVAGITKGCNPPDDTEFCPNGLVTRGQLATFLDRALELPGADNVDYFTDDNGSVYEPAIQRLAAAGIMDGCSADDPTLVCPADPVTRGQAAAYLVRAVG